MSSAGVMSENRCVNEEIAEDIDGARLAKRHKFASRYRYKGTSGSKRANQARVARERRLSKNVPAVRVEDSEVIHSDSDSDRTVDYDVDDYMERTAQSQGTSRSRVKLSLMSGTSAAPEQEGLDADHSNTNSDGKCYHDFVSFDVLCVYQCVVCRPMP